MKKLLQIIKNDAGNALLTWIFGPKVEPPVTERTLTPVVLNMMGMRCRYWRTLNGETKQCMHANGHIGAHNFYK
jgi:hypothetical protein